MNIKAPQPFITTEPSMIEFQVNDMSCGHCSRAIERAIQAIDPDAHVAADPGSKRVRVLGARASVSALAAAMAVEGYPAQLLDAQETGVPRQAARSCCGSARCG